MSTALIVGIAIIVGAAVALAIRTAQRRSQLRGQFGSEYDRTVKSGGSRREAEREVLDRRNRIEHMDIRSLDPAARDVYRNQWAQVQERFVDTPADAEADANDLPPRPHRAAGRGAVCHGQYPQPCRVGHRNHRPGWGRCSATTPA